MIRSMYSPRPHWNPWSGSIIYSLCTFLQLSQSDSGWTNRMRFWLSYESGKCKRHYILCNFPRGIDLRYAEVLETTGSHRKTHPKSHCVQVALRVFDISATKICDQKVYNLVDALLGFDQFERSGTGRKWRYLHTVRRPGRFSMWRHHLHDFCIP